jgi:hypothetical protein
LISGPGFFIDLLGIFKKTGTSKAEDVVSYCEDIWRTVDLDYNFCSAVVTDTEATMCKAGRLMIQPQGKMVEPHNGMAALTIF